METQNQMRDLCDQSTRLEQKPPLTWRHLLVAPCVFLHLIAYNLSYISIGQYIVLALYKMRYPYHSDISSGDQAACHIDTNSPVYIRQQKIQAEASLITLYGSLYLCIPGIISNLIYGTYIDKFGRSMLFVIALAGTFFRCTAITLGIYFELNVYIIIIFNVFEGMTGTWVGTLSAAFSYVADITSNDKNRSFAIAIMEICVGLGTVAGVLSSGYIIKSLGFIYTFVISSTCTACAIFIVIFVLPETVKTNTTLSVGVFKNIKQALSFYFEKNSGTKGKRWKYTICLAIFTLLNLANIGFASVYVLYLLNSPFCWNSVTIGNYSAIASILKQVVGMLSIKLLQCCFSDITIALIGALSGIAGFVFMGVASSDVAVYMVIIVSIWSVVPMPMIRGIMSRMTPTEKQGSMFAGLAAMEAVTNLVGNIIATGVYTATVAIFHGIVYFVLGSFTTLGTVLIIILAVASKMKSEEQRSEVIINKDAKNNLYGSIEHSERTNISTSRNDSNIEIAESD